MILSIGLLTLQISDVNVHLLSALNLQAQVNVGGNSAKTTKGGT